MRLIICCGHVNLTLNVVERSLTNRPERTVSVHSHFEGKVSQREVGLMNNYVLVQEEEKVTIA
jgi:hypothetical protein